MNNPDPTYEAVLKRCADALIPENISLHEITRRLEKLIDIYNEIETTAHLQPAPAQMQLTLREQLKDIMLASCGVREKTKVGPN